MSAYADWLETGPRWLTELMRNQLSKWTDVEWGDDYNQPETVRSRREVKLLEASQAIGSEMPNLWPDGTKQDLDDVLHLPMFDLDMPTALVRSTTNGHYHLYINKPMPWKHVKMLMRTMVEVGLLEEGYEKASIKRGETFLRLPWIRKGHEEEDAQAALNESLRDPDLDELISPPDIDAPF